MKVGIIDRRHAIHQIGAGIVSAKSGLEAIISSIPLFIAGCQAVEIPPVHIDSELRNPDAKGQPIVFLNGYMNRRQIWDPLLDIFSNHPIILWDYPGINDSEDYPDGTYTLARYADAMNRVVKQYNLDKYSYAAYSMGNFIAEIHATLYPNKDGVCYESGFILSSGYRGTGVMKDFLGHQRQARIDVDGTSVDGTSIGALALDIAGYAGNPEVLKKFPIVYVVGSNDQLFSKDTVADFEDKMDPTLFRTVKVPGMTHVIEEQYIAQIKDAIRQNGKFLNFEIY